MLLTHPKLGGQQFIIRTQPPIIVGQVVKGNIEQLVREHQPQAVGKPYEHSEWAVFYVGLLQEYKWTGTAQEQAEYLAKIIRKMSDFYVNLIK